MIAVQPTAIDELRFFKERSSAPRLDRYSAELSDRWKLSGDPALPPSNFDNLGTALNQYSRGTVALLQHSIYDEISFRDHLLVSCTDGLLVYRPTAVEARISGGVEEEVSHWGQALVNSDPDRSRPAAIVHVFDELRTLVDAYIMDGRAFATIHSTYLASLSEYGSDDAEMIFNAYLSDSLDEPNLLGGHLRRLASNDNLPALARGTALTSIYRLLSAVCKVNGRFIDGPVHFIAETAAESTSTDFLDSVTVYLRRPTVEDRDRLNEAAAEKYVCLTGLGSPAEFIAAMRT